MKEHHHFFGQTDVVSLVRDFVAFYPLCHGEFFMVNGEGVIAVYIAEKSKQQGTAEGPWLAFVIAEIFYFQTDFFHDFSMYRFFNRLSDFRETCNQCVTLKSAAFVLGEDDLIAVGNPYDDSRAENRIFMASAGRAFLLSLLLFQIHTYLLGFQI